MFLTKLILILTLILAIIFMGTHICTKDTAIYVQAVYCEDCERWLSNYHQWTKHLTRYKHRKNTDPNFVQSMKKERKKKYFGVHRCMKTSKTFCEAEADVLRA